VGVVCGTSAPALPGIRARGSERRAGLLGTRGDRPDTRRLPMTAVLLTTLFLGSDGFLVIPLTIVAVVVAYVAGNWLAPVPTRRASGNR
jgi:hypothetical protein